MLKLASSLGFALALADLRRRIRIWVRSGILAAAGAVVLLISFCFFLVALHLWISRLLNPIASAAIIGGVLLLIALILFLLAFGMKGGGAARRSMADQADDIGDAMQGGMSRFGAALGPGSPLKNPIFQAAGLAIIGGFLLGRKSKRGRREPD
jgi:hypothetical protein